MADSVKTTIGNIRDVAQMAYKQEKATLLALCEAAIDGIWLNTGQHLIAKKTGELTLEVSILTGSNTISKTFTIRLTE